MTEPVPGHIAAVRLVGVIDGDVTAARLHEFAGRDNVKRARAAGVPAEIVYSGAPVDQTMTDAALRLGVRLHTFIEYQGLIDFRPLLDRQADRLATDERYPAELYVPQRYRMLHAPPGGEHTEGGLLDRVITWLGEDAARFVVVLGDFGRGKTFLSRQLVRELPRRVWGAQPILVDLRSLEKAPALDSLLEQHLWNSGVTGFTKDQLSYMIQSGRTVLIFDGYDELALRATFDQAADYLATILEGVSGQAKVVLTSRTQHFQSDDQVLTALGGRISAMSPSRVAIVEDFTPDEIRAFLVNYFGGDENAADTRYRLLEDIEDLIGVSGNPRMLSMLAEMDVDELREIRAAHERVSAARLYGTLIDSWLREETRKQTHPGGLPTLDKEERLTTCSALAVRLWTSATASLTPSQVSDVVTHAIPRLTERRYTADQAAQAIGSRTLLVRDDKGNFGFVHQSVLEWLIAKAAAERRPAEDLLNSQRLSPLMAGFLADLAERDHLRGWVSATLADPYAPAIAKENALQVTKRLGEAAHVDLSGVDLRDQDLSGRDLRGANLSGADLRGMRLTNVNLASADLRDADLRGVRLIGGDLSAADITGSRWTRAALLDVSGIDRLLDNPELGDAAIAVRDPADVVIAPPAAGATCVAYSSDESVLAYGQGNVVVMADAVDGSVLRVLTGHNGPLRGVAFSPDGTTLATASYDDTARLWDTATGQTRTTLTGHTGPVMGVAFSPDGTTLATTSSDNTARLWDTDTGELLATFVPLRASGYAVLLPDGSYKLKGDPRGTLWWVIKLCRFEAGEIDDYVPEIWALPLDAKIIG